MRKEWRGELPGGRKNQGTIRTHFTGAKLAPAPTTQGHRGQEVVYTFRAEMKLKAAETIKMTLGEGAARIANCTYHVHPHRENAWRVYRPSLSVRCTATTYRPSPRWQRSCCNRRGGRVGTSGRWGPSGARYRRGQWMTRGDTKLLFPMVPKVLAGTQ